MVYLYSSIRLHQDSFAGDGGGEGVLRVFCFSALFHGHSHGGPRYSFENVLVDCALCLLREILRHGIFFATLLLGIKTGAHTPPVALVPREGVD